MQLAIACTDRTGIAQDVLDILAHQDIDLTGIEINHEQGGFFLSTEQVALASMQTVMAEIRKVEGVKDVKTTSYLPMSHSLYELENITDQLNEPLFSMDLNGKRVMSNQAANTLFSWPLEKTKHKIDCLALLQLTELPSQYGHPSYQNLQFNQRPFLAEIRLIQQKQLDSHYLVRLLSPKYLSNCLHQAQSNPVNPEPLQAVSLKMRKLLKVIDVATRSEAPLLISGETGTGKDLLATMSHNQGSRKEQAFLVLSCATLPDNVAENELFGHAPFAFSNEDEEGKKGLLQLADKGTLYLDEVGDMSAILQVKLLRFLEQGKFRRVGDEKEIQVDVRIICATQHDILDKVQSGEFRQDLYYRLNVLSVNLPPLRERKEDIIPLAEHFVHTFCAEQGKPALSLSEDCCQALINYPWPGNVRQLKNVLLPSVSMAQNTLIDAKDLALPQYQPTQDVQKLNLTEFEGSLEQAMKQYECQLLKSLFPSYPSSRLLAKKLGLSHTAIANKLKEHGINKHSIS
ncbi:transcriptional regulatory protein [Marinomonas sp. MED121]|uniref:sigma 54-interacting transcriptional regulator n=1 Tax=Marinomonas sp. MED121 TaxID=314277 RepID=UPI00006911B0|nr:sigma 54-interacting transcriptional regulator [Marinomonas sp. MED121]EAQ67445.1 transcriptional regulatory protein [Marinomonas sp. MED121]